MVTRYREVIEIELECSDEELGQAIGFSAKHFEKGAQIKLASEAPFVQQQSLQKPKLERPKHGLLSRPR